MSVMTKWLLVGTLLAASSATALLIARPASAAEPAQLDVRGLNNIQRMAAESGVDLLGLEYKLSDPVADPGIAAAIRAAHPEYAEVSPAEIAAGAVAPHFFFNRFDLNGDGDPEVLALVVSPVCGSGGCPALVFAPQAGGYRLIGDLVGVETPIIVSETVADSWRKLLVPAAADGLDADFRLYVFNGENYEEVSDNLSEAQATKWRAALISDQIGWDTPGHALTPPNLVGSQSCRAGEHGDSLSIGGIVIGASGNDVRDILGDPASTSAREIWDADGLEHQRWYYPEKSASVSLVFDSAKHAGRVEQVEVGAASSLRADCGIGIGSSERDLSKAYGEASEQGASRMIGDPWAGLELVLEGGRVVTMRLGASAE